MQTRTSRHHHPPRPLTARRRRRRMPPTGADSTTLSAGDDVTRFCRLPNVRFLMRTRSTRNMQQCTDFAPIYHQWNESDASMRPLETTNSATVEAACCVHRQTLGDNAGSAETDLRLGNARAEDATRQISIASISGLLSPSPVGNENGDRVSVQSCAASAPWQKFAEWLPHQ